MNLLKQWKYVQQRYDNTSAGTTIKHLYDHLHKLGTKKYNTRISVENIDTVLCALKYPNALLLNMGNADNPGGYVSKGLTGSQEEDLFRRSNLYTFLNKDLYPIKDYQVLLSKNVEIFAYGIQNGYALLPKPRYLDIITCPAIKNEYDGAWLSAIDEKRMKIKIETILQTAMKNNYPILVLSALGCGGFKCPPEHVSILFKQALKKYDGYFDKIIFAIFDENYSKSNYQIFKNTFLV